MHVPWGYKAVPSPGIMQSGFVGDGVGVAGLSLLSRLHETFRPRHSYDLPGRGMFCRGSLTANTDLHVPTDSPEDDRLYLYVSGSPCLGLEQAASTGIRGQSNETSRYGRALNAVHTKRRCKNEHEKRTIVLICSAAAVQPVCLLTTDVTRLAHPGCQNLAHPLPASLPSFMQDYCQHFQAHRSIPQQHDDEGGIGNLPGVKTPKSK